MRISYNPRFDERLESAGDYVAREFGEAASRRFKVTILEACHMLSIFPYMGFRLHDLDNGKSSDFRILISGYHAIIYYVGTDAIEIMSLVDMRAEKLASMRKCIQNAED